MRHRYSSPSAGFAKPTRQCKSVKRFPRDGDAVVEYKCGFWRKWDLPGTVEVGQGAPCRWSQFGCGASECPAQQQIQVMLAPLAISTRGDVPSALPGAYVPRQKLRLYDFVDVDIPPQRNVDTHETHCHLGPPSFLNSLASSTVRTSSDYSSLRSCPPQWPSLLQEGPSR
jgi:hypothetical protein